MTTVDSSMISDPAFRGDQFSGLSYHVTKRTANGLYGVGGMKNSWIAPLSGLVAGSVLAGAWFGAPYVGVHLQPATLAVIAAILAFATSTATFAFLATNKPVYGTARATLNLNEEPASEYVFPFKSANLSQIFLRPETPLAVALARFGTTFDQPSSEMKKNIIVTLRASGKIPFPTTTLQQLFKVLKSFNVQHILLLDDKDRFVAYIPGPRALKDFTGDGAADKITKYIASVLEKPETSDVVHEIGGTAQSDTIKYSQDIGDARKELWKDESVQGLVVLRKFKPIGYISRLNVLKLHAGLP
jgi:hypothetical protein